MIDPARFLAQGPSPLSLGGAKKAAAPAAAEGGGFSELLSKTVSEVDGAQAKADSAVQGLMTGKTESVHEVSLALTEAELSFKLMLEVRNRLVEAYQEVSRMQV